MKKTLLVALSVALIGAAIAAPASAKKTKAKPVATTLYFHGASQLGEMDSDGVVNTGYLPMDVTKPTDSAPKSRQITNYAGGPNWNCAGNNLFPVWVGHLTGHVVGTLKVTVYSAGSPSAVDIRVWPDVNSQLCDSDVAGTHEYIQPAAHQVVTLPAGQGSVTATMNKVDFSAAEYLMVQVTPDGINNLGPRSVATPSFDRVLYDAAGYETSVSFSCIPAAGASDCTS